MKKTVVSAAMFIIAAVSPGYTQDSKLPGYLIGNFTILNQAAFDNYLRAAGPVSAKFRAKVIVYKTNAPATEGDPKKGIVVLEFPSVADAHRFYDSPEYTAARKLREGASDGTIIITEGAVPPHS